MKHGTCTVLQAVLSPDFFEPHGENYRHLEARTRVPGSHGISALCPEFQNGSRRLLVESLSWTFHDPGLDLSLAGSTLSHLRNAGEVLDLVASRSWVGIRRNTGAMYSTTCQRALALDLDAC